MSKEIAIEVKNLSKYFRLPTEKAAGIKQAFVNWTKGVKGYKKQQVLRDISFNVEKGDFFGIVGRNGSGKSTLLKLISGIYEPNGGNVKVNGSLVSFIELGVGFNPELTGRDNVYLNGALMGFTVKEIAAMYDDIVNFAELSEFMDQKLKNYSSGMQVRLAFSCAIRAKSDILILDEVLAVGDEAFQKKCNDYFYSLKKDKKTVVLVTHSMESVRQFCNKALLLGEGKIAVRGNPDKVASKYSDIFINESLHSKDVTEERRVSNKQLSDVALDKIQIISKQKAAKTVNFREDFSVDMQISCRENYDNLAMGVFIIDQSGRSLVVVSTKHLQSFNLRRGDNHVRLDIQNVLPDGDYYLNIAIEQKSDKKLLLQQWGIAHFSILGVAMSKYNKYALMHPRISFKINDHDEVVI